jgi:hypothetical protein
MFTDDYSTTVEYRVDVDWSGCWTAIRVGPPLPEADERREGCVTLLDVV